MMLLVPVGGPSRISSRFGIRRDPISGAPRSWHPGIDIAAPLGADVYAALPGRVIRAYFSSGDPARKLRGYGHRIVIAHDEGLITTYSHLSERIAIEDLVVSAGALIGRVGSTGASTGPHLHLELICRGTPIDPEQFLSK